MRLTIRPFTLRKCSKNIHFKGEICRPKPLLLKNQFFSSFRHLGVEIQHPKVTSTIRPFALSHCVKDIHFKLHCVVPSHSFSENLFEAHSPLLCCEPLCQKLSFQPTMCCLKPQRLKNKFFSNFGHIRMGIQPPKVRTTIQPFALSHCVKNIHFKL